MLMEENSIELYTAASVGLETQNTIFVVKRTFGGQDLLDLYSDYVVKKVRESFRRRDKKLSADDGKETESKPFQA